MPPLTRDQERDFLQGPALIGKLGTLRDGWPYVNPIWYEWDSTAFWIISKTLAQFVNNINQDDRAFLVVDKEDFAYVRVNVEGRAHRLGRGPRVCAYRTAVVRSAAARAMPRSVPAAMLASPEGLTAQRHELPASSEALHASASEGSTVLPDSTWPVRPGSAR